ncbi:hypothetical protein GW916_00475 [bacterium]|nr:hypothetical protein [bacterium]
MERRFLQSKTFLRIFLVLVLSLVSACSKPSEGEFFQVAQGTTGETASRKLVFTISNGAANAIASYSESGKFLDLLADTSSSGLLMRGLAPFDSLHVLMANDGQDGLNLLSLEDGSVSSFVASSLFTGNIYNVVRDEERSRYYVIETNNIEAFNFNGLRLGNPYIPTTLGACVISGPRSLTMTKSGYLAVANYTNNDITVYDVSGASPTCVNSYTGYGNDRPTAIVGHSDGFLYIGFTTNDRIDRLAEDGSGIPTTITNDLAYVNNPTALLEMPDGSLLIASDGIDGISRIDTSGNPVEGGIFIKDALTGLVTQMSFLETE